MEAHHALPSRAGGFHRTGRWLGRVYVLVAVALGLMATGIVVGPTFGLSIVRLATGSMSPGLPSNSLLLVRDTPASEVDAGDVITVQRPDHRPVTHRVVSTGPSPDIATGMYALILRGDANAVDDPQPYLVDSVGRMLFGIPTGGQLVTAVATPVGMGVLTLLFGALTLWVFWPAQTRDLPSEEMPQP